MDFPILFQLMAGIWQKLPSLLSNAPKDRIGQHAPSDRSLAWDAQLDRSRERSHHWVFSLIKVGVDSFSRVGASRKNPPLAAQGGTPPLRVPPLWFVGNSRCRRTGLVGISKWQSSKWGQQLEWSLHPSLPKAKNPYRLAHLVVQEVESPASCGA